MKKVIYINGQKATIELPKTMSASDIPNEVWTIARKTVNVGIRQDQKTKIKELIMEKRLDLSVNKIVQFSVDKFLDGDVNVATGEGDSK